MSKEEYIKRMKVHQESFETIHDDIINDTNAFIDSNPTVTMYDLNTIEGFTDHICKFGAWVQDRINGYPTVPGLKGYNKSISKKVRNALGYNL